VLALVERLEDRVLQLRKRWSEVRRRQLRSAESAEKETARTSSPKL
jgi:hypothetical protein